MLRWRRGRYRAIILLLVISAAVIAVIWATGGFDSAGSTETAGLFPRAEKISGDTMQVTFTPAFMDMKFDEVLIDIEHGGHASDQVEMSISDDITVSEFIVTVTDLAGDGRIDLGDSVIISNSAGDALHGEYTVNFRWVQDGTFFGSTSLIY